MSSNGAPVMAASVAAVRLKNTASAVWSPRSSPTCTGWWHWGLVGLSGSPPIGLRVRRSTADRLVAAARAALPSVEAQVARQPMISGCWHAWMSRSPPRSEAGSATTEHAIRAADHSARLGHGPAANYGAAVGDLRCWPGARQLYRASGLSPAQYESAGKRRRQHQPRR